MPLTTFKMGCVLLRQGFGELLFEAPSASCGWSEVEWYIGSVNVRTRTQCEVTSNQSPVTREKVKIMELLREERDFAIRFFSGNWLLVSGNSERSEDMNWWFDKLTTLPEPH